VAFLLNWLAQPLPRARSTKLPGALI